MREERIHSLAVEHRTIVFQGSVDAPILGLNPGMVARASKTEHVSAHGYDSSTSRISVGNVWFRISEEEIL
eukprot:1848300-Amphidinium_carterae.1